MQGDLDFESLLEQCPDDLIHYLVNSGTKLLGSFKVKVGAPLIPEFCVGFDPLGSHWSIGNPRVLMTPPKP